jgi:hypothetical protein
MQILTIHPGPTLMVYENGSLIVEVPLSPEAAQWLAIDMQVEAMRAQRNVEKDIVPYASRSPFEHERDCAPVDADETH